MNFIKNLLPTDLQSIFELNSDIHSYQTNSAHKHLLHIPRIYTTTYGNKSIKYHCPILWNATVKNNITILHIYLLFLFKPSTHN